MYVDNINFQQINNKRNIDLNTRQRAAAKLTERHDGEVLEQIGEESERTGISESLNRGRYIGTDCIQLDDHLSNTISSSSTNRID